MKTRKPFQRLLALPLLPLLLIGNGPRPSSFSPSFYGEVFSSGKLLAQIGKTEESNAQYGTVTVHYTVDKEGHTDDILTRVFFVKEEGGSPMPDVTGEGEELVKNQGDLVPPSVLEVVHDVSARTVKVHCHKEFGKPAKLWLESSKNEEAFAIVTLHFQQKLVRHEETLVQEDGKPLRLEIELETTEGDIPFGAEPTGLKVEYTDAFVSAIERKLKARATAALGGDGKNGNPIETGTVVIPPNLTHLLLGTQKNQAERWLQEAFDSLTFLNSFQDSVTYSLPHWGARAEIKILRGAQLLTQKDIEEMFCESFMVFRFTYTVKEMVFSVEKPLILKDMSLGSIETGELSEHTF